MIIEIKSTFTTESLFKDIISEHGNKAFVQSIIEHLNAEYDFTLANLLLREVSLHISANS